MNDQADKPKGWFTLSPQASGEAWLGLQDLRWYAEYRQAPLRLQRAWESQQTGEIEWRDVPTEYGPNAAP